MHRSQSILSAQAHQLAGDKICETGAGRRAQASRRRWAPSPQLQEDEIHLTVTASFHVTFAVEDAGADPADRFGERQILAEGA